MSRLERIRLWTLVCLVAALAVGASAAPGYADEPVEDEFPPPEKAAPAKPVEPPPPAAKGEPAPAPPAKASPAPGWSQPAVTPGAGSSLGSLPPPRVVKRRSGARSAPRAAAPPVATRPLASTARPPSPRPAPRRAAAPLPPRPAAPRAPASRPPPPPPPLGAAGVPAGGARVVGTSTSRVYSIAKTHNVQMADGELALRLDIDYEVLGESGRDVYVAVWFARADGGGMVQSALADYADRSGRATVQTRSARVAGNAARFNAVLHVPYRAFPVASGTDAYDVEARVQILRQEGAERVGILATGSTTFRVYGYSEATR